MGKKPKFSIRVPFGIFIDGIGSVVKYLITQVFKYYIKTVTDI